MAQTCWIPAKASGPPPGISVIGAIQRYWTQDRSSLSSPVSRNLEPLPPQLDRKAMSMQQSALPGPFETIVYERRRKALVEVRREAVDSTLHAVPAHDTDNIPARRDHRDGTVVKETSK